MAKKVNKYVRVKKGVNYSDDFDTYTIQLKKRRHYWWLLLFLLPLLLLIQCHKDIKVKCVEPDSGIPVSGIEVALGYDAHFLWKDGHFLPTEDVRITQTTDEQGVTVFEDLPCSVFSYLFYCFSEVEVCAESDDCHGAAKANPYFHFTRNVTLEMDPHREDLHVLLLDLKTGDYLPDGILLYEFEENGVIKKDSVHAESNGVAIIPQMRSCGEILKLTGTCYGYADTVRMNVPCRQLVIADRQEALRLRPIEKQFTFFVKNKDTKQPIPDAQCVVTLTHPGESKNKVVRHVRTSIDGKGIAVCDSSFMLSTIAIHASKYHYKDGDLEGGPWVVEFFKDQDDDIRTVWLEPEPYLQEFINRDSITGNPIPGVRNVIRITHPDGTTEDYTEISNRNGVFPIMAKEDDRVEVISTKEWYEQKRTTYPRFGDVMDEEDRVIRMKSKLPPCDGGVTVDKSGNHERSFNMGQEEGVAEIRVNLRSCSDVLTIYDGVGRSGPVIFGPQEFTFEKVISLPFTRSAVTVVIEGGSGWDYEVKCPKE